MTETRERKILAISIIRWQTKRSKQQKRAVQWKKSNYLIDDLPTVDLFLLLQQQQQHSVWSAVEIELMLPAFADHPRHCWSVCDRKWRNLSVRPTSTRNIENPRWVTSEHWDLRSSFDYFHCLFGSQFELYSNFECPWDDLIGYSDDPYLTVNPLKRHVHRILLLHLLLPDYLSLRDSIVSFHETYVQEYRSISLSWLIMSLRVFWFFSEKNEKIRIYQELIGDQIWIVIEHDEWEIVLLTKSSNWYCSAQAMRGEEIRLTLPPASPHWHVERAWRPRSAGHWNGRDRWFRCWAPHCHHPVPTCYSSIAKEHRRHWPSRSTPSSYHWHWDVRRKRPEYATVSTWDRSWISLEIANDLDRPIRAQRWDCFHSKRSSPRFVHWNGWRWFGSTGSTGGKKRTTYRFRNMRMMMIRLMFMFMIMLMDRIEYKCWPGGIVIWCHDSNLNLVKNDLESRGEICTG